MNTVRIVPLPSLASLIVLSGGYSYAEGRAPRLDPLKVMSARHYQHVPTRKRARTKSPSRHYLPLDALNGRIIVKDAGDITTQNKPAGRTQRSSDLEKGAPEVITLEVKTEKRQERAENNMPPASPQNTTEESSAPQEKSDRGFQAIDGMILPPEGDTHLPPKGKIVVTEPDSERLTQEQLKALIAAPEETIKPSHIPTQKAYHASLPKTLYMTFDDGPIRGTANLLRVLRDENVEATMFYIGREVVHSPMLFQQTLAMPNILVANHTYTHANNHYRHFYNGSADSVVADIDKAQLAIGGAKYLRLCGRNVWRLPTVKHDDWGISVAQRGREIPKYDALHAQGYFIYGWDVEWAFSHKTQRPLFSGEEMARRVNLRYSSHHTAKLGKVIMLAHDFMFRSQYNAKQLRTFIQIMKAQGWHFATIDDYSSSTPDVYLRTKTGINPNKLKPAQALAKKAKILIPENKPEVVLRLAPKAPDVATQLSHAIRKQSFLAIRRLLAQHRANINGLDPRGKLPLNLAIRTNNAVLVRMMVERGARIFNMDADGISPMGVARELNNTIIIRFLKQQIALQNERRLRQTVFASNESMAN
jgi:peptidoglycan/xylan/chitin deacetylase (PgdA/CDA1 family)